MKIGIIGASLIGGTLTRRFRQLGHDVAIADSRGSERVSELAQQTGAKAVSVRDATRGRDVVVITISELRVRDLPSDLFRDASEDLVVIDACITIPAKVMVASMRSRRASPKASGWSARSAGPW